MIEKIELPYQTGGLDGSSEPTNVAHFVLWILTPKINEMIDAINKLEQTKTTTTKCKNCGHHTDYGDGDCVCEHEYGHMANHLDICQHYGNQNKHCQWFI